MVYQAADLSCYAAPSIRTCLLPRADFYASIIANIGDAWYIRWKNRQTKHALEQEIPLYRRIAQSQSFEANDIY